MEATIYENATKAIETFLDRKGYDIIERGWAHGSDRAGFIAREDGDLVFVTAKIGEGVRGLPRGRPRRPRRPRASGGRLPRALRRGRRRGPVRHREHDGPRRQPRIPRAPPQRALRPVATSAGRRRPASADGEAGVFMPTIASPEDTS